MDRHLWALVFRWVPLRDVMVCCRRVCVAWKRFTDHYLDVTPPRQLSVAFCGHVDAGKSTALGHMAYLMGAFSATKLESLREAASRNGMESFTFAYYANPLKEERERGITVKAHIRQAIR